MRHRFKRMFADTVYRMRTVGASPERQALALAIGVFIGCSPFFGLHLALCLIAARLLQLSPVTMYAGAQISYPVFAPFLYYGEIQVGSWIRRREFLDITVGMLRGLDHGDLVTFLIAVLGDLVVGWIVLGFGLGVVFGLIGYEVFRRTAGEPERIRIAGEVSRRYLEASILDWEYARARVKGDPVYLDVIHHRLLPDDGLLVDLGCGRGLLLALICEAEILRRDGGWPDGWPAPPTGLQLVGVDRRRKRCQIARTAVGDRANVVLAQLENYEIPPCRAVALIDVLHYLPAAEQDDLLRRVTAALAPGGVLLLREADTAPYWRFTMTRIGKRVATLLRGTLLQRFRYRPCSEWREVLERLGFEVETIASQRGGPSSSVLMHARKL